MTKKEAITKALHLLDMATVDGAVADSETNGDLTKTMEQLLNNAVIFAGGLENPVGEFSVFNKPLENLASNSFETKVFDKSEQYTSFSSLAHSCYFCVAGLCNVKITADNEVANFINQASGFTTYRYSTSNDSGIKIEISSDNMPFFVKNVALYREYFQLKDNIPPYGLLIYYNLPEDFISVKECILENLAGKCNEFNDLYLSENKVGIPYYICGEIFVKYYRKIKAVPANAADDFVLDCCEQVSHIVPLKLAILSAGCYEIKSEFFAKLQKMVDDAVSEYRANIANYHDPIKKISTLYQI